VGEQSSLAGHRARRSNRRCQTLSARPGLSVGGLGLHWTQTVWTWPIRRCYVDETGIEPGYLRVKGKASEVVTQTRPWTERPSRLLDGGTTGVPSMRLLHVVDESLDVGTRRKGLHGLAVQQRQLTVLADVHAVIARAAEAGLPEGPVSEHDLHDDPFRL
jgi:hypothetical protein